MTRWNNSSQWNNRPSQPRREPLLNTVLAHSAHSCLINYTDPPQLPSTPPCIEAFFFFPLTPVTLNTRYVPTYYRPRFINFPSLRLSSSKIVDFYYFILAVPASCAANLNLVSHFHSLTYQRHAPPNSAAAVPSRPFPRARLPNQNQAKPVRSGCILHTPFLPRDCFLQQGIKSFFAICTLRKGITTTLTQRSRPCACAR